MKAIDALFPRHVKANRFDFVMNSKLQITRSDMFIPYSFTDKMAPHTVYKKKIIHLYCP